MVSHADLTTSARTRQFRSQSWRNGWPHLRLLLSGSCRPLWNNHPSAMSLP